MASKKNRPQYGDLVVCTGEFTGRNTPPNPAGSGKSMTLHTIPSGAHGLFHGDARGVDSNHGLRDVEFELDGAFVRVETPVENLALVT